MNLPVKYRPQRFSEIAGQEYVVKILQNALKFSKISRVYLFSGPRGVGKTTTARIFAKALNCQKGMNPEPCNECKTCKEIQSGKSLDVIEIDGASHRGIAEVRELQERINFAPSSRYKVVIIDEVHMLTNEAFNALLKTLEEPPQHVVFILATTSPEKIPLTVLSRCQRFDFKPLDNNIIIERLKYIAEKENMKVKDEVFKMIASKADGSLRDAINILSQLSMFADGVIDEEKAGKVLGIIKKEVFVKLFECVKNRDVKGALKIVSDLFESGYSIHDFVRSYAEAVEKLLRARVGMEKNEFSEIAGHFYREDILGFFKIALDMEQTLKYVSMANLFVEYFITRLVLLPRYSDINKILDMLKYGKVEKVMSEKGETKKDMESSVIRDYNNIQHIKKKIIEMFDLERV